MTYEEKLNWLRLIRTENIGPVTFFQLLKRFGSPLGALKKLPQLIQHLGKQEPLKIPSLQAIEKEYTACVGRGIELIIYPEEDYPENLRHIPDPPPVISLQGNKALLKEPTLAIVGARNASLAGRQLAEQFAAALSEKGFVIISGLARGIDTAAHEHSLEKGTIAVLAGGLDHIYPKDNEPLYKRIGKEGLLISEAPLGTVPQSTLFPRRNRLISGIADGTVVIEAALKSGSLITARYAVDQGREVFCVPGNPLDARAQGTNLLIQEGAALVQCPEEIVTFYSQKTDVLKEDTNVNYNAPEKTYSQEEIDRVRQKIFDGLSLTPVSVDSISEAFVLPIWLVRAALVELALTGSIVHHFDDQVARLPSRAS